jgi:hypothetical protein
MKKAHFVMQGKGGIGKSYIACLIAQRYLRNGGAADVECVDTDPVNKTLCGYASLKAMRLELLEKGAVKERNFDMLMERILSEDKHFVVDSGATSFLPISRYLSLTNSLELIAQAGKKVVVHSVVVGGQELLDTLHGLDTLASSLSPPADLVVWLNEHNALVVSEERRASPGHRRSDTEAVAAPRRDDGTAAQVLLSAVTVRGCACPMVARKTPRAGGGACASGRRGRVSVQVTTLTRGAFEGAGVCNLLLVKRVRDASSNSGRALA